MTLFQILLAPLCAALAAHAAIRTGRRQISRRQGLFWCLLWTAGTVAILSPMSTNVAASYLGIGRGADLVFYLAIVAGLWVCLAFYNRFRQLEAMITELVRRDAIEHARQQESEETG